MPPRAPIQPGYGQQPGYPPQQPIYPQPQASKPNYALWGGIGAGVILLVIVLILVLGGDKGSQVVNGGNNNAGGGKNGVGQVVISDAVDETTQAPRRELNSVSVNTNPIYASVPVKTDKAMHLVAKWFVNGEHVPTLDTPYDLQAGFDGWVSFHIRFAGAWPAATYGVQIFQDGQKVQEKSFPVQ